MGWGDLREEVKGQDHPSGSPFLDRCLLVPSPLQLLLLLLFLFADCSRSPFRDRHTHRISSHSLHGAL